MCNRGCKGTHSLIGNLFFENVRIVECNYTSILHRSPSIFVDEHLLVFVKGERITEVTLIESHRLNCNLPDKWSQILKMLYE
jgi:hypothetical protein